MFSPKVSVIIVSYNTRDQLTQCLHALTTTSNRTIHEVIVVDNGSVDGSPNLVENEFSSVRLVRSTTNLGFGKANNLGASLAEGDLLLFLNSDAYADVGSIDTLASAFEETNVVAAGGKLLNTDGTLQESVAGKLTLTAVFLEQFYLDRVAKLFGISYWRTRLLPKEAIVDVDQVMGACLMVRRSAFEKFDPRFFLYCEDTELCARLSKKGRIVYVRNASFFHELGSSSNASRWRAVARYNLGKELYFRINHGRVAQGICWILNRLGAVLRILVSLPLLVVGMGLEKLSTFVRVLFASRRDIIPADYIPE